MQIRALMGLLLFSGLSPLFAFAPQMSGRIGVLQTGERHRGRIEREISAAVPKALRDELRRAGADARLLTQTREEVTSADGYDYLVEVIFEDVDAGYSGGVAGGVDNVGVEVSMGYAQVFARVVLYDGQTLEVVRTIDVEAHTSSPAVTGVGVGGRSGFLFIRLPFAARAPHRRVARALARNAAAQIAAR